MVCIVASQQEVPVFKWPCSLLSPFLRAELKRMVVVILLIHSTLPGFWSGRRRVLDPCVGKKKHNTFKLKTGGICGPVFIATRNITSLCGLFLNTYAPKNKDISRDRQPKMGTIPLREGCMVALHYTEHTQQN